ncbi:glyoxalase/bleomycin resistance/extradiol dioxygenase family protein [Chitinophaga agrisoli]|uniref:Glyoxalase/bleomycin resistance/extradiol dioxygenase family protein n=1 Tax=Chitinophaga agrisoli TaxID=2607653 RepID=A0A5B2W3X1_9BACT|nr:VOC family protein [Chitinophaga agrisoli]KAA2245400.1 glyoxalase/bleomycin resistance/extradiol dioxygenase family protein [Chitinophaga agrisoli]
MATKVFINLPVKELNRSMDFFTALGFSFNPQFTDEKAACMVVSESIYVMLLTESYFQTFTRKSIANATQSTEVLIALDAASRDEAKQMISKAQSLGAQIYAEPQDHGWMYQHSFADLDGHQWEFVYMDESQLPNQE